MTAFKSSRIVHEYTQNNPASPDKIFPLICPVREGDWLPRWQYRLIYSDSGVAELGCIFNTPSPPTSASRAKAATETTWIVTEYDPSAFRVSFVWVNLGSVITEIRIQLTPDERGATRTHIRYRYTGLSPEGNREVESYDRKWFEAKMKNWETTMNHYLRTGKRMSTSDGE